MVRLPGLVSVALLASAALAGEYNEVLKIGDAAPAWSNLPGTDGARHSLSDLKAKKLVVVVFTCNSCPVAADYEDRIIAFATKHSGDVAVVAINVNRIADDNLAKMKDRAEEKKFPYSYLFDETQKIAKEYGAVFTPEFFVLGLDRKVEYMGAMDDNSDPTKATQHHLEQALAALRNGEKPKLTETLARGCRIRYARERR
jgi:peroxiredoxin